MIFGKDELTDAIMWKLKKRRAAPRSREIATAIIATRGDDARDRKYLAT